MWCTDNDLVVPKGKLTMVSIGRERSNQQPFLNSKFKAGTLKIYTAFMAHMCYLAEDGSWESKLRATSSWGAAEFLALGFTFIRPGPPEVRGGMGATPN